MNILTSNCDKIPAFWKAHLAINYKQYRDPKADQ